MVDRSIVSDRRIRAVLDASCRHSRRGVNSPVADTIVPVSSDLGYMREYKMQVFIEPENMLTANLRKCVEARKALPAILETVFTLQVVGSMEKELAKDGKVMHDLLPTSSFPLATHYEYDCAG